MKITIRLVLSLLFVAFVVTLAFAYVQVKAEEKNLLDDLDRRCLLLGRSLESSARKGLASSDPADLAALISDLGRSERLHGVAVYDGRGAVAAMTPGLGFEPSAYGASVGASLGEARTIRFLERSRRKESHIFLFPVRDGDRVAGVLGFFNDIAPIRTRLKGIWRYNFLRLMTLSLLLIVTTVLVVRWSVVGPIAVIAEALRNFRIGSGGKGLEIPRGNLLGPLASEVTHLTRSLSAARARAEEEARLRLSGEKVWTAERLKEHVRLELGSKPLVVVSNREPYMHVRRGRKVEVVVPAGGLVTALDPMMRACGGVWIAHGGGDADAETADRHGRLQVPPDEPAYTLKRVWLSRAEEEGYYYGFSNEGLWPLCHITHTRPDFKLEDWACYRQVNERFAHEILREIRDETEPLLLIQDYHFALVPALVKAKRPDARVAIFWHIPWPNPEAFSICPWQKEILAGLLGADLVGFHIQFHCNNFLETVDRVLESRIDWEKFSVERGGQVTSVKPFPISVAFPSLVRSGIRDAASRQNAKDEILTELGLKAEILAVGVDRIDYTKGLVERFQAVERFFDKHEDYLEKFTFIELGAPSRTHIKRYRDLISEVEALAERINWKFQAKGWKPIVFLKAHHDHREIERYYRAADLCLVTSLHDGMNLVAKEFVAARDDDDGVLILSPFTGAARELLDALLVNPYDIEALADGIHQALTMRPEERQERMRRMREVLRERNVYRWAGNLVTTLNRIRVPRSAAEPGEKG